MDGAGTGTVGEPGDPTDPGHGGRRAIAAAFLANLGIAAAKFVGFLVTGAASMLAEAIHSVADTANQALLMLGRARGGRHPDADHPLGYGRERYFWAFVVALVLFTGGAVFAVVEGEEKLRRPHEVESPGWALAILGVAFVLEGLSLRTAARESRRTRQGRTWWRFIRQSKSPDLPVVLLEDSGALLGLLFATAGIVMAEVTGDARFDALGSLAIGVLLAAIAVTLAVETKSLLIGESADPRDVVAICEVIERHPDVERVVDLRTEHLGPEQLLVVGRVRLSGAEQPADVLAAVASDLRSEVPGIAFSFLEPVAAAPEEGPPRRGRHRRGVQG